MHKQHGEHTQKEQGDRTYKTSPPRHASSLWASSVSQRKQTLECTHKPAWVFAKSKQTVSLSQGVSCNLCLMQLTALSKPAGDSHCDSCRISDFLLPLFSSGVIQVLSGKKYSMAFFLGNGAFFNLPPPPLLSPPLNPQLSYMLTRLGTGSLPPHL